MTSIKKALQVLILLALLALSFAIGRRSVEMSFDRHHDLTQSNTQYKFISPLLECGDYQASNLMNSDSADITDKLQKYIAVRKSQGLVSDVALYFRDLNNGPYVNINASGKFVPGSLLKVPVALSFYKQAEKDPSLLTKKAVFSPASSNLDERQHYLPPESIQAGKAYSLEDLMRYMLVDSDNNAAVLAVGFLNSEDLIASYGDLGLQAPVTGNGNYTVTVKNYASFFRILYNASYLNQTASEHVLSLLSQSKFTDGLVAGVPSNVVVAHKFGERSDSMGKVQLHDCGIVYRPNQPYVLCIMTEGTDFDLLAATIADISRLVYKTLDADN